MAEAAQFMIHLMVIMIGGFTVLATIAGAYSMIRWVFEREC